MNGSIKMIDSLVEQLNNAKLDGTTGMSMQSITLIEQFGVRLIVQRSSLHPRQSTYSTFRTSSRPQPRSLPRTASPPPLEHSLEKSPPTNLKMLRSTGSSLVTLSDDPCLVIPTSLSPRRSRQLLKLVWVLSLVLENLSRRGKETRPRRLLRGN